MRLYIAGHNAKKGYAIAREWSDEECSSLPAPTDEETKPVRFSKNNIRQIRALLERWNRRFASH